MTRKLYALYDLIASDIVGGKIIIQTNDHVERRNLAMAAQDHQSPLAQYPHDFALVTLGEIDEHGRIAPNTSVKVVATVATLLKEHKQTAGLATGQNDNHLANGAPAVEPDQQQLSLLKR